MINKIKITVDIDYEQTRALEGRVEIEVSREDFNKNGVLKPSVVKEAVAPWDDFGFDEHVYNERWSIHPQEPDEGWPEGWKVRE